MEVRFVAWLIWRIHLAFRQMGVGGGMGCQFALAFLKNLPFAVVLELAEASQEAFDWLAEHFPDVNHENPGLQRFASLNFLDSCYLHMWDGLPSALAIPRRICRLLPCWNWRKPPRRPLICSQSTFHFQS